MKKTRFDIVKFCKNYGINYVEHGANVSADDVGMRCPWCGDADPSEHLGIDKKTGAFNCWRNSSHKGATPHRLIAKLLGCSYREADRIVREDAEPQLTEMESVLAGLRREEEGEEEQEQEQEELEFLDEFKDLANPLNTGKRFRSYLVRERGIPKEEILDFCSEYEIKYATTGPWKDRIIIPIRDFDGMLVGWSGRSITDSFIRYKTLSPSEKRRERQGGIIALKRSTDCLLNIDSIADDEGEALIITEGPFDAMKLDFWGTDYGVRATCLFGLGVSSRQKSYLMRVRNQFDRILVVLDAEEHSGTMRITSELSIAGKVYAGPRLPDGVGDPGDLTRESAKKYITKIIS